MTIKDLKNIIAEAGENSPLLSEQTFNSFFNSLPTTKELQEGIFEFTISEVQPSADFYYVDLYCKEEETTIQTHIRFYSNINNPLRNQLFKEQINGLFTQAEIKDNDIMKLKGSTVVIGGKRHQNGKIYPITELHKIAQYAKELEQLGYQF